jgi:hypothetical protein
MLVRFLLVAASLVALDRLGPKDELVFAPAAGTTLARTLESRYVLDLESFEMTLNDEAVPPGALGKFELHIEHSEHYGVTDTFEALGAGRPERLRRSFDELGGREATRTATDDGEQNDGSDYASVLAGKVVVFTWNESAGRCDAAFATDSEGDSALLAGLEEDLDLRRLLPSAAVSPGDTWELDGSVFQGILGPGGDLALEPEDDEEYADTTQVDAEMRANMGGTIHATYRGIEEEGGARYARIELALETKTHAEDRMEADADGTSGTNGTAVEFRLAGELRWDVEHGHALSLELGGDYDVTLSYEMRGEMDGESFAQVQTMKLGGEIHLTSRVERHCARRAGPPRAERRLEERREGKRREEVPPAEEPPLDRASWRARGCER